MKIISVVDEYVDDNTVRVEILYFTDKGVLSVDTEVEGAMWKRYQSIVLNSITKVVEDKYEKERPPTLAD